MSSTKLPPISEIKFSESIKKKLYFSPRSIQVEGNKYKSQSLTDRNDSKTDENLEMNSNSNDTFIISEDYFKKINENITTDDDNNSVFSEVPEIEGDNDVDDDDDEDDEFDYLYREEDDQINSYEQTNSSEVDKLKKQLSFLKKENYYMQLAISKLETRTKKQKEFDYSTISLGKHLSSIENYLSSKQDDSYSTKSTSRSTLKEKYSQWDYYKSISNTFDPINHSYRENTIISNILNNNHLNSYRSLMSNDSFNDNFPYMSSSKTLQSSRYSDYSPRKVYNLPPLNFNEDKKYIDDTIYAFSRQHY